MEKSKDKLNKIIQTIDDLYLNKSIMDVSNDTSLSELGIDSLGKINLFYGIIDFFEIEKDESLAAPWSTINDVILFLESL